VSVQFYSLIKEFFDGLLPDTRNAYRRNIKRFLDFSKVNEFDQITVPALLAFREELLRVNTKYSTINHCFCSISSLLEFAKRKKIISENPALKVPRPTFKRQPKLQTKTLSYQECQKILEAAKPILREYAIIFVLLNTGMEAEEMMNLRIRDLEITDEYAQLHLRSTRRKITHRTIIINMDTANVIMDYLVTDRLKKDSCTDDNCWMFGAKKKLNPFALYFIVRRNANKAGLNPKITPYSLRMTVAKLLAKEKNVRKAEIKELINIKDALILQKRIARSPTRKLNFLK